MNQNHLQMTPNWAGSLLSPYTALLAEEFFIMNTELLLLLPLLNNAKPLGYAKGTARASGSLLGPCQPRHGGLVMGGKPKHGHTLVRVGSNPRAIIWGKL